MVLGEERAKTYEVHHDPDRKRKGLPAWAVVEIVDACSLHVICRHTTLQDALQTKAALETRERLETRYQCCCPSPAEPTLTISQSLRAFTDCVQRR